MTLRKEAIHALDGVPDFRLPELIRYMRFLSECPVNLGNTGQPKGKPSDIIGILKGRIWVSEDFDEPMELLSASEIRELRGLQVRQEEEHLQEAVI